jgi:hypothetical protein
MFSQGAKVELGFHHVFTHSTYIYIFHTYAHIDLIVWLVSLDPLFDFTIYALQVCMHYLPTYKLHISLLVIGWEREGIMLFCLSPKILHILREERRQSTIVALVRIHKYHIWETWEGHTKESLSFILKILQNSRMKIDWRIWDIVFDLIILSSNCSRLKWRLQAPWLKVI